MYQTPHTPLSLRPFDAPGEKTSAVA